MSKRLLTFDDILEGENRTIVETQGIYPGLSQEIPLALNVLTQLNYFKGNAPDIHTNEGSFYSYCGHQYLHSPYSFRACYMLWERSYYLESAIILRLILERFIQIRYLYRHQDLVNIVWSGAKKKGVKAKKITFKDMFEDIVPGYYDKWYGPILSGFAHSKLAANYFRIERTSPAEATSVMIPRFDKKGTLVINKLIPLLFGYLKFFPIFFPDGFRDSPQELLAKYQNSVNYFKYFMDGFKEKFPESLPLYEYMDKIINP